MRERTLPAGFSGKRTGSLSMIVGLVGVQLVGPLPRASPLATDGRDCVDQRFERQLPWTLAPVSRTASGMPCRSVAR